MDSVAVMEVAPVPDPPFIDATPLPPAPLAALALRRSARCLNRPVRPSYVEQEPPKPPSGRGRGKRKRDEEKQEQAAAQGAKSPGRKASNAEPGERRPSGSAALDLRGKGRGKREGEERKNERWRGEPVRNRP